MRGRAVEPVFGIIKEVMGFRRFSLRGHAKVALEWILVCVSYILKRLFTLKNLATPAQVGPRELAPGRNRRFCPRKMKARQFSSGQKSISVSDCDYRPTPAPTTFSKRDGLLGDGTTVNRIVLTQVPSLSEVVAVAAGGTHSLALKRDGTVWAWGANTNGRAAGNDLPGPGAGVSQERVPIQVGQRVAAPLPELSARAARRAQGRSTRL